MNWLEERRFPPEVHRANESRPTSVADIQEQVINELSNTTYYSATLTTTSRWTTNTEFVASDGIVPQMTSF